MLIIIFILLNIHLDLPLENLNSEEWGRLGTMPAMKLSGRLEHTQGRCHHAVRMPGCRQDEARTPEWRQEEAKTPSKCLKTTRRQPGWLDAIRMPGRCQDDGRLLPICRQEAWNCLHKSTLTKWLFQVMKCVVSKCKFCALFYLLLSTLLYWNGLQKSTHSD